MPEPTTHTAVGVGIGSAGFAAGTVFGVEYVVIVLALLGGATSLIYLARMPWRNMVVSIVGATMLGVVASMAPGAIFHDVDIAGVALKFSSSLQTRMFIAFVVAFFAQKGAPLVFSWMDKKGGGA